MLGIGPYLVARLRRVPFVLDERDLSLDAASELALLPKPIIGAARLFERWVHHHADLVVAVTPGMRKTLEQRGVPRLATIPNGFDALTTSAEGGRDVIRIRLGWEEKVVFLYAGGLGQAYDLDTVFDALATLQDPTLLFAVMGDNEGQEMYRHRAARLDMPVHFLPPVSKRDMVSVCAASDVCLLPLRNLSRSSYVLSNKLFDYLGAGRPVIVAGPSDSSALVEQARAGVVVPAGESKELASAISLLAREPDLRRAMGAAGKSFVETFWRREQFAEEFRRHLLKLTDSAPLGGDFSSQLDRIRAAYRRYDGSPDEQAKRSVDNAGVKAIASERSNALTRVFSRLSLSARDRLLDIGCGTGGDLERIAALSLVPQDLLFGVDLLGDRITQARRRLPSAHLQVASAHQLPFPDERFSIVLAATVFSSIRDNNLARAVAREITRVTRPGGKVICYDVRFPNPGNPDTRPITRRRLSELFPEADIEYESLTLLPPLARRLGRHTYRLYEMLCRVRALRSHYISVISPHDGRGALTPGRLLTAPRS
jgi:glycosyltransferase involved in cell wall biosynthesis/ubiquinone/menaquinone biosynthesis C-methylase UbiE